MSGAARDADDPVPRLRRGLCGRPVGDTVPDSTLPATQVLDCSFHPWDCRGAQQGPSGQRHDVLPT